MRVTSSILVATLLAIAATAGAIGQQPPPTAPAGVVPPDQKLPPHIRKALLHGSGTEEIRFSYALESGASAIRCSSSETAPAWTTRERRSPNKNP